MEAAAAVAARETEAATRHPWCGRSLGGIVSPAGLGFCRAALDDTLGPSFLDTAGDTATLAGDWSHLCTVDTLAKRLRHCTVWVRSGGSSQIHNKSGSEEEAEVDMGVGIASGRAALKLDLTRTSGSDA